MNLLSWLFPPRRKTSIADRSANDSGEVGIPDLALGPADKTSPMPDATGHASAGLPPAPAQPDGGAAAAATAAFLLGAELQSTGHLPGGPAATPDHGTTGHSSGHSVGDGTSAMDSGFSDGGSGHAGGH